MLDGAPEGVAGAAFDGLMGRGRRPDPAAAVASAARDAAGAMLREAAALLGMPSRATLEHGRVERVVTEAAAHADLLVVGRDGDRSRLGPHSLGRHTRFVVDHAPSQVLVVWPGPAPDLGSIPSPPPPPA